MMNCVLTQHSTVTCSGSMRSSTASAANRSTTTVGTPSMAGDTRAREPEQVGDLLRPGAVTDADGHEPRLLDGEERGVHGRPVGQLHRDAVAAVEPEAEQRTGPRGRQLVVVAPREPLGRRDVR